MSFKSQQLLNKRLVIGLCASALLCAVASGCAVSPAAPAEAPRSQKVEQNCSGECVDEHSNHQYQYYLGVLSVLLLG